MSKSRINKHVNKFITLIKQNNIEIKNTEIKLLSFEENLKYKSFENFKPQNFSEKIENIFLFYENLARLNRYPNSPNSIYGFDLNELGKSGYLHKNGNVNEALINN